MKYIVVITIFCFLVILSSFLHNSFLDEYIEGDLAAKTKAVLRENGLDYTNVGVNGHHLEADFASGLSETALDELDGVIGIYLPAKSGSNYTSADPVKYSVMDFRVEKKDGAIYASGKLPDREYQLNLLYLLNANANNSVVIDKTTIAEKPDYEFWWDSQPVEILPDFLNGSEASGYIHFLTHDFVASATFNDKLAYQNTKEKFSRLPQEIIQDVNVTYVESKPKPKLNPEILVSVKEAPSLFMTKDANDNIVIRGTVNSKRAKNELIVAAKVAIPTGKNVNFTDKIKISKERAPFDSLSDVKSLMSLHIQRCKQAEMVYNKKKITLKGIVHSDDEMQALVYLAQRVISKENQLTNLLKVDGVLAPIVKEVAPVERDYSQDLVNDLKPFPIYFETSSAKIQAAQEYKIKRAAEIIQEARVQDVRLTVGGYADLRGNVEVNKKLSLERANAVRVKLVEYGVSEERLVIKHFGEDASKLSENELWKARRVAITITKTE